MNNTLKRITEEAKTLPPQELYKLREIVDSLLEENTTESEIKEDEFERQLVEQGFLRGVPQPITDFSPYENYKPIEVSGQPISEMIVEERR